MRLGIVATFLLILVPIALWSAEPPRGWTADQRHADEGVLLFFSSDRELVAQVGPAFPDTGLPVADQLDAFLDAQLKTVPSARRGKLKTRNKGGRSMAWRVFSFVNDQGVRERRTVWAVQRASRPTQFVTITGSPKGKADRRAIASIISNADQPALAGSDVSPPPEAEPPTSPSARRAATPALLKPDRVRGVVHSFGKRSYHAPSGLFRFRDEGIWILFRDGWAYRMTDDGLGDFDIPRDARADALNWTKIDTLPDAVREAKRFRPQKRGARLSLSVSRPNSSGTFGRTTSSIAGLVLKRDGRFETSYSSLTSAAFGAPPAEGYGYGGGIDRKAGYEGEYEIDGYTITLTFDTGEVLQTLFATRADGSTILGDTYYWVPKN